MLRVAWAGLVCWSAVFGQSLAITEATVYESASASMRRATVVIADGRIQAVGERAPIPSGAVVIRCAGCVVVAGFWNSHVHFTEPKWEGAAGQPAGKLSEQIGAMLTRSGFTTVVDTASMLANTLALRRRIESGEVLGPRILTAGAPIFPPNGVPYYVKDAVPAEVLREMAAPRTAEENLRGGADLVKLFTGSWVTRGRVMPMPDEIAVAAVKAAHGEGKLVFAHPSNLEGVRIAIDSKVDVLAHAPDDTRGVDEQVLRRAVKSGMAMIPTLKLFSGSPETPEIRRVVGEFHRLGGRLVFGTDSGYLTDYDVREEFEELAKVGLDWREVLRMLTENPARLFRDERRGRVGVGMIGDLTILDGDPARDFGALWRVRYTVRDGRVIWRAQ
ncbi:MAG: amidohydrolase family protein [Acidobacteria bacterium]|nr:amidohydrolase family protein [Acidobacteriota bacterium]